MVVTHQGVEYRESALNRLGVDFSAIKDPSNFVEAFPSKPLAGRKAGIPQPHVHMHRHGGFREPVRPVGAPLLPAAGMEAGQPIANIEAVGPIPLQQLESVLNAGLDLLLDFANEFLRLGGRDHARTGQLANGAREIDPDVQLQPVAYEARLHAGVRTVNFERIAARGAVLAARRTQDASFVLILDHEHVGGKLRRDNMPESPRTEIDDRQTVDLRGAGLALPHDDVGERDHLHLFPRCDFQLGQSDDRRMT